jgi:hypothetical protein
LTSSKDHSRRLKQAERVKRQEAQGGRLIAHIQRAVRPDLSDVSERLPEEERVAHIVPKAEREANDGKGPELPNQRRGFSFFNTADENDEKDGRRQNGDQSAGELGAHGAADKTAVSRCFLYDGSLYQRIVYRKAAMKKNTRACRC